MTVLEQLRKTIEDGHPGETEKLVREALKQHIPAGRIVEEAMTPAMRTVGENYKSNGADIIKILAAARSVRKGFELLEEQDSQFGRRNIGTVILGTVEGDLHDVGKNLVAIMFRSAGFKVIDLGVDISVSACSETESGCVDRVYLLASEYFNPGDGAGGKVSETKQQ